MSIREAGRRQVFFSGNREIFIPRPRPVIEKREKVFAAQAVNRGSVQLNAARSRGTIPKGLEGREFVLLSAGVKNLLFFEVFDGHGFSP